MAGGGTKTRVRLRCHDCGNKFYAPDAYPEACPICGVDFEQDPGDVICLPALHGPTSSTPDKVFRQMETASIQRAEEAASLAGVPVSEMSNLKITDLRDNVIPGETYAKPVRVQNGVAGKFQGNGAEYAKAAHQPIQGVNFAPNAGMNALGMIQRARGR